MTLADWLAWQERLNPKSIELGLDRTRVVAARLDLTAPRCVTATIGGTNGKGSSAALAAGIWQAAGYRVGRYLSPHLLRYNERIAIDGQDASDDAICAAFAAIEAVRGDTPLTYFEFGTLAALWLFREARVDVQVLEVGLGGRLDAVNVIDADAALVTNIGLDHTDWLGPDRDAIGVEKAGIYRAGRPAICAEAIAPATVRAVADSIGARWLCRGSAFEVEVEVDRWHWRAMNADRVHRDLPLPALPGAFQIDNAAGVLMLVDTLQDRLPVQRAAIDSGLRDLRLAGRYQRIGGQVIVDVAHNRESAAMLVAQLRADPCAGRTRAVVGMLSDKPVTEVCALLAAVVDHLYCAGLPPPRGLGAAQLLAIASDNGVPASAHADVAAALAAARADSGPTDRIIVCGSFLTVAAALEEIR